MYKFKIAVRRDSFYFKKFSEDTKLKKYAVNDDLQMLKLLKSGRVDLIISNYQNQFKEMSKLAKLSYDQEFKEVSYFETIKNPRYFSISKHSDMKK